jgi:hypothetical protein
MVLESENFPKFFDLVEVANFEIASDAFSSFKVGAALGKLAAHRPSSLSASLGWP